MLNGEGNENGKTKQKNNRSNWQKKKETTAHAAPLLVCYTAVFSVVTQCSFPQTAAENRTTFLSLCVCGLTNKPIMYKKLDNT